MRSIEESSVKVLLGTLTEFEEKFAPEKLYLLGNAELIRTRKVSVVGSRKPTPEGEKRARALCRSLVAHGISVVSGLAEGIDTIAHTVAIRSGGNTIAVVGTPLDQVYPRSNRDLFEEIAAKHLVITQFPAGYPTQRKNFVMRNRTMALLSDATVIVEAGPKSGTAHQGWEALRLGRLLFIMESVIKNNDIVWAKEMMEYGAQQLSRENLEDVLQNLPELTPSEAVAF